MATMPVVRTASFRSVLSEASAARLEATGAFVLRYGLVFLLFLFGGLKWTAAEAQGIQAWMAHSPLTFWVYNVMSVQHGSELIGAAELLIGALIGVRRWSPRLSAIGSLGATAMFLTTLSFLLTTSNDAASQQFLMKDIILLGAAIWTAGEAAMAARRFQVR